MDIFKQLADIANELDKKDLKAEANAVDSVIKRLATKKQAQAPQQAPVNNSKSKVYLDQILQTLQTQLNQDPYGLKGSQNSGIQTASKLCEQLISTRKLNANDAQYIRNAFNSMRQIAIKNYQQYWNSAQY